YLLFYLLGKIRKKACQEVLKLLLSKYFLLEIGIRWTFNFR
ncbi:MAG: hypothetical protein ACI81W_002613, partial [Saprospiraceae bacterium]